MNTLQQSEGRVRRELWWTVVTIAACIGATNAARAQEPAPAPGTPVVAPAPATFPDVAPPGEPGESGEPAAQSGEIEAAAQRYQNKVTLSSGARSQALIDFPMTLTYLSAGDIEGTGQFTLCDTVQLFPGMECRRGAMRQSTVSTRGLGFNFLSNRLLMLKDGRPDTDPWTGSFRADEANPLTNVKQIEVIRGPGSSLYGSNAFAGVINYVTRSPDDVIAEGKPFGVDGRFLLGSHDTYRAQVTAAAKYKDLKGLLNYYFDTSAGSPQFTDPVRNIVDTRQWSRVHQASAKVEFKVVKFDANFTDSLRGQPGGNPTAIVGSCGRCHYAPKDTEHVQDFNAQLTAEVPATSWLSFSGRVFTDLKRRVATVANLVSGDQIPSVGDRLRVGGDVKGNLTLGPVNIVAGGDVKVDQVDSQSLLPGLDRSDLSVKSYGGYADGELKLARKLIIGAGLRIDGFDVSKNLWKNNTAELSPRASVVFHALPQLTLRANYGHAFRAPTMVELGLYQTMYASTLEGNPYLKPERLNTFEAAVDAWPFGEVLRLTATGFYTLADNFISEVSVGTTTARFSNIGGGRLGGVELEAASQIPKLHTSVNLSYQFLYTELYATREPFDYAAAHRFQFRTHTAIGGIAFADVYGAYVGPRSDPGHIVDDAGRQLGNIVLPGYFLASARVGFNIVEGLSVSALATNIFNVQYQETLGFPSPGTQLFVEAKFVY